LEKNWWWRSVGFWIALQLGLVFILFLFFLWDAIVFILWFKRCFCVLFLFMLWNTNFMTIKLWVKSHYRGGGGQKCCHIILFSRGVHVWTSIMVILEHIFSIFLHSMVDYNTKNSITKKIFQLIMCNSKIIFVTKKCTLIRTKKCKYIQKMIEMIFNLYEICSIYLKLWFLMTRISLWTMWRIW